MDISELSKSITKSSIRVMYDKAREIQADDMLNFTVGEPDFTTPKSIAEEACKYIRAGYSKYTPNSGIDVFKEAVAEKFSPLIRPIDGKTEVMITVGATEAILVSMMTVLNPGDEIVCIAPFFASYMGQFKIVGAVPKIVEAREENGFVPTAEQIEAAIGPKTKMLLLNSPCNPTGAEIPQSELKEIAEVAIKHDLIVISDEVYKTIRYSDTPYLSIASIPGMAERTIVVDAISKTFASPGWRVGYAIGPERLISNMPKTHDIMVACVNAPFQYAAAYALMNCDKDVQEMRDKFLERRNFIVSAVRSIEGLKCFEPAGAFYLWINIKQLGLRSEQFCFGLLEKEHMAIVPGNGFGDVGEGYVRFTYASNIDLLSEGVERLGRYVASLR